MCPDILAEGTPEKQTFDFTTVTDINSGHKDKVTKYIGTAFHHTIPIVVNPKYVMHS